MQPRREAHSGGHAGFVPTRFGTRGRGFKSRRLDQDPETAFLSSRGLCCCEGFEPQPPKRLEMRRLILGCRFMRADAGKGCPLAEVSRSRDARGRSPSCGSEAIEPLIIPLTSYLPIEAKIIPSPRPKTPQRLPSAEFLFVLRFVCNACVSTPGAHRGSRAEAQENVQERRRRPTAGSASRSRNRDRARRRVPKARSIPGIRCMPSVHRKQNCSPPPHGHPSAVPNTLRAHP